MTIGEEILPVIYIREITETDHRTGVTMLLAANRRQLSLVDCVSFIINDYDSRFMGHLIMHDVRQMPQPQCAGFGWGRQP